MKAKAIKKPKKEIKKEVKPPKVPKGRKAKKNDQPEEVEAPKVKTPKVATPKVATPKAEPRVWDAGEQTKRVGNMFRDMEKYALVDFSNEPNIVKFRIINIRDEKKVDIQVKDKSSINCSCMDWRIRGRKNNINCKHILYVVSQILGLEYAMSAGNLIHDFAKFEGAFGRIKIRFGENFNISDALKVAEDREISNEEVCPICFTDFASDAKENLVNCVRCKGIVHRDCMICWLKNAVNKTCVFCGDKQISKIL